MSADAADKRVPPVTREARTAHTIRVESAAVYIAFVAGGLGAVASGRLPQRGGATQAQGA